MAGKFLLGNSETMEYRGYLANRPLLEVLLFAINKKFTVSKKRAAICKVSVTIWGEKH